MLPIGVTGVRTTIVQEILAIVPNEAVVSIGRHPSDDVVVDLGVEFDVAAIPVDLDRYVLAAGVLNPRPLAQQTFRETATSLAVNLTSVIRIFEHVIINNPHAQIAVIGSESWRGSYDTSYFLSKVGINAYFENRRLAFPEQQLVVVSPTIITDAGMTTRRSDLPRVRQRADESPQKRFLDSAEVARLIHYCLYINRGSLTNTVVSLNGGVFT
jgi:NADP-dependent 3-hydroxy acid dehydrogenase YdfG